MSRASGARSRATLAAVVLAGTLSCATAPPREQASGPPPLAYVEGDASSVDVRNALTPAIAALGARGLSLPGPPRIVVHADSASFRAASGQSDPSLRAWSTWSTVHLMPLSTWTKHDEQGVRQRVTHELCHVALYRRFGTEQRARAAKIPRFFEEGVCSVVAGQQRPHLMTIAFVASRGDTPQPSPLQTSCFVADPELAYAAAHHAIAFLDRTLGPRWLGEVLDRAVADGAAGAVERALLAVTGYDASSLWPAVVASVAPAG